MIPNKREETNKETLIRDHLGRYRNIKDEDDLSNMTRPLTHQEHKLIEEFIAKKKSKELKK